MKKSGPCCRCPSLKPSRNTAQFYLLFLLIALYMLVGALVFSSLERPAELQAHRLWEKRSEDFAHKHGISLGELKSLLRHYEEARISGVRTEQGRALWDLPGAFYFVGTVVSTIGFGVSAPSTVAGKILLVFYGLLGCSASILFFNLFLERVITLLTNILLRCRRNGPAAQVQEKRDGPAEGNKPLKPSIYQLSLILFVVVMLVACAAASLYSAMEGWTYLESLYFCFVAFSTVGFGDLVSGQRAQHGETRAYQVANCLLMLLGVCCMYSLFNSIAVIIKQALSWLLGTLERLYNTIGDCRRQLRPLFKFCIPESNTCYCDDKSPNKKHTIAVYSSDHGTYGKAHIVTISNRNMT
ncbi:potassium channel subfamily K member 13 [Takifugu flavidus]|uniref:Potassium channel subfamily K member 13 n=1 Tax=Takifugu flavidus TaxID=433684 RepID=A0A5C6PCR5_9TELE|nr:potassium channel subfamily K member 13 [Takifugu flavidus]TWW77195.1 Potassium channel subfamily K member 13 [Takifugu flavidus]